MSLITPDQISKAEQSFNRSLSNLLNLKVSSDKIYAIVNEAIHTSKKYMYKFQAGDHIRHHGTRIINTIEDVDENLKVYKWYPKQNPDAVFGVGCNIQVYVLPFKWEHEYDRMSSDDIKTAVKIV